MKRILLLITVAVFAISPMSAQLHKVDISRIEKAIEKSNSDIQHDKRSTRANTWLNRGDTFYEAASEASYGLFLGLNVGDLPILYGDDFEEGVETIAGRGDFATITYPWFKIFVDEGVIVAWRDLVEAKGADNPLETSYEAYAKAYELDDRSGTATKVSEGINRIANKYKELATSYFTLYEMDKAQDAFYNAYKIQLHPTVNEMDTLSVFNAGFMATVAGNFETGLEALKVAKDLGFERDGDLYFYMFHCYYGLGRNDDAKNILLEGVPLYPNNSELVEGLLSLYATTEGSDATEIIPLVQASIERDPENSQLWMGMGRIYDELGEIDKAFDAFTKAVSVDPSDFYANLNLGNQYIKRGNEMNQELNSKSFTSNKDFEEGLKVVNEVFHEAISPLEKAHELQPENSIAVELLKNIYFRFRDDSQDMMDKFNHYDALYRKLEGQ